MELQPLQPCCGPQAEQLLLPACSQGPFLGWRRFFSPCCTHEVSHSSSNTASGWAWEDLDGFVWLKDAGFPCNSCFSRWQLHVCLLEEGETDWNHSNSKPKGKVGWRGCKGEAVWQVGFWVHGGIIDLQSTCEEGMDVRQLTEKGFFAVFSYFSPHCSGNFALSSLRRRTDKDWSCHSESNLKQTVGDSQWIH